MKKVICTENAPSPVGPYSQAIQANGMLYVSGQVALVPGTKALMTTSIEAETTQVMANLKAILDEAKITFEHVVKVTIFLSDMGNYKAVNDVYGKSFNHKTAPARECVAVKTLPLNVNVEISLIAMMEAPKKC